MKNLKRVLKTINSKTLLFVLIVLLLVLIAVGAILVKNKDIDNPEAEDGVTMKAKVHLLYNEKLDVLTELNEYLRLWYTELPDNLKGTFIMIERSEDGEWRYFSDDYKRNSVQWRDGNIDQELGILFVEYEVDFITITPLDISYKMVEDLLIYSPNSVPSQSFITVIEDSWYHYAFTYGT